MSATGLDHSLEELGILREGILDDLRRLSHQVLAMRRSMSGFTIE
jgi:hypothetical protein